MRTILYGTDYSTNSVAALKYAKKMTEHLDCHLVVCHVYGYPIVTETIVVDELPQLRKNALKANRYRLEEFCAENLGENWSKEDIKIAPVEDIFVVDGIVAAAKDWHAEFIIVGTKGESILTEALLGSTTKHLIQKSPCPVLAIPPNIKYVTPKTMVYATDFEEEDIDAIGKLVELAESYQAKIKIVHISPKKEYSGDTQMEWFKNRLQEKVAYKNLEFELIFSEYIFKSLEKYLTDVKADLVGMLARKKSGFLKRWFHWDLVKKMESHSTIPVLSFNEVNYQMMVI